MSIEGESPQYIERQTIDDLFEEAVVKKVKGKELSPSTVRAIIITGKNLVTILTLYELNPKDTEQLAGGYIGLLDLAGQRPVADVAIRIVQAGIQNKPPK